MSEKKWYPVQDWASVKRGDWARLEHKSGEAYETLISQVNFSNGRTLVRGAAEEFHKARGWKLFTQQKPIDLPTKPGIYVDKWKRIFTLGKGGGWFLGINFSDRITPTEADLPLTRYRPEHQEAHEALEKVYAILGTTRTTPNGIHEKRDRS